MSRPINRNTIIAALALLGGTGRLSEIYDQIARLLGRPLEGNEDAAIRMRIEESSPDSANWNGRYLLFYSVYGIGNGVWGLECLRSAPPADESDAA
jgi:hypothetical protein